MKQTHTINHCERAEIIVIARGEVIVAIFIYPLLRAKRSNLSK